MKRRNTGTLLILVLLIISLAAGASAVDLGYQVTAPEDQQLGVGEEAVVHIRVTGASGGVDSYNAYDLTLTYDTARLEFLSGSCRDQGAVIEEDDGTIRVVGYGADKAFQIPVLVLRFRTLAPGEAEVVISRARVDAGANAITQDAPPARLTDSATVITVLPSYTVTLGEGLSAESLTAQYGVDYVFRATDPQNYTYAPKATIGGREVTVEPGSGGTYRIPGSSITGPITIQANRTPKSYTVTLTGTGLTGEKTAAYNSDYTFKLTKQTGYSYTVTVTIGGKEYKGYTVKSNAYTIPGTDITGNITVKVTSKKNFTGTSGSGSSGSSGTASSKTTVDVSFVGSGAQDAAGSATTKTNTDYSFTLNKQEGYTYDISVQVDGQEKDWGYNPEKDVYTVPARYITGDVTIVITKHIQAQLQEYVTLDGASIYLVIYSREVEQGQVPRFDGQNMYWSDRYSAYVWLILTAHDGGTTQEEVESRITLGEGQAAGTVNYTGNINLSSQADINDAQLAHDIYNAVYTLEDMEMIKFLNADVNSDKRVDVLDAEAVMGQVLAGE